MIDCARVQAALSARLDGEDTGVPDDVVDAHLSGCVECQAFFEQAARLNRQLRLTEVPVGDAVPDLSEVILAGVEPVRRRRAASRVLGLALSRVMLILVGLGLVVWAYRLVALSTVGPGVGVSDVDTSAASGLLVDAAAIRLALACGLFFAAWRPQISAALMPVYGAFAAFSCGFATRDLVLGQMTAHGLVGLALLVASAAALLWAWLNSSGFGEFGRVWRSITAQPY